MMLEYVYPRQGSIAASAAGGVMQKQTHMPAICCLQVIESEYYFCTVAWELLYMSQLLFGNAYLVIFSRLFAKRERFRNERTIFVAGPVKA